MAEQTERKIQPQRGWDYLKHVSFTLQMPRPHRYKADVKEQPGIQTPYARTGKTDSAGTPLAQIEHGAMDEHRVGLKQVLRRVWARKGQRPIVRVQHRYEWLYVYGFLHPQSGSTYG